MSTEMNPDNLALLRARVAELEAAEAAEAAAHAAAAKKENAMDRLQAILAEKKLSVQNRIARPPKDHLGWLAHNIKIGEVEIIDTLIDIIDGLHNRIAQLEEDKVKAAVATAASS
jgi:hypothetical protein